jgi:membrane fusion protein (multidrug efflux system)
MQTAEADVNVARAGVETARINLAYTRITAPISGRIETSTVTPGALVVASQDTALTTVQQLDPIYVDVTQSTTDLLRLKRELADGTLQSNVAGETPMTLLLEDGSTYVHKAQLKFSGVSVTESTGTVTLRAVVPNPEGLLMPGMYVRGVLEQGHDDKAILLPQKAVTRAESGATSVLVVVDGKVEKRVLTIGRAIDNQWWVTSGLKGGEQVIIEGGQKVAVGESVNIAQPTTTATANETAKADSAAQASSNKEG